MRRMLLLLVLMASAVVFGPAASAVTTPELGYACALKSNGNLRMVSSLSQCSKSETAVSVRPGPTYFCYTPSGSVRLVTTPSGCANPKNVITLPKPSQDTFFCVLNSSSRIDMISGASCPAGFTKVVVSQGNSAPTDIQLSNSSVSENNPGATVGTLSSTDPNPGDTFTYTVNDSRFEVVAGALKLKSGNALDRESASTVSLLVTTTDQTSLSYAETFVISVTNVNEAPTAVDDEVSVFEDYGVIFNVLDNDTDPDGDTLQAQAELSLETANGSAIIESDGTATYLPDADFCGSDGFDYYIADTGLLSDTGHVSITVTCVNDAPEAADETVEATEDTPLNIPYSVLINNDQDIDALTTGDTVHFVASSNTSNLTATDNSLSEQVELDFAANFCGTAGFDYQITDDSGATDTAHATVNVACVNDPPVATDDSRTVNEDANSGLSGLRTNDSDPDGDTLSFDALTTAPTNGTASISGTLILYQGNLNYCGPDSLEYRISDGNGGTDTATVSITVTCLDDSPVANDDFYTTAEDTQLVAPFSVIDNDTDVDTANLYVCALSPNTSATAEGGSVSMPGNGTFTYTPPAGFTGTDSFGYIACQATGPALASNTATVSIEVG